jgi:T5SS/PEP-CTERM-associated repeat protein
LFLDILSDSGFVVSDRRYPIPTRPEVLPHKVPSLPSVGPRNLDGALPLHIPHYLRYGVISSVQSVQELNNGNQRLLMTGMTGGSAVYLVTFADAVPVATNLVGTIPNGVTVFSVDGSVQFNDRGSVVVYGGKAGNISGLYRIGGEPVVEFGGQNEYSAFSSFAFALNNNDEVAFLASSHSLQKVGCFRGPNPITDKIVLAGDIVAGSQISQFSSFGPKRGWFNDRGQIVFIGTDFNSEEGIWVTSSGISPPDPNSTIIRWNPPVSPPAGSFAVTDNWQPLNNDPPRVPQKSLTLNDTALFDWAEAYAVDFEGNHEHVERLVVKNGNVVFVNGAIKADATSFDIPSMEVDNARLDIATAMTLTNNHSLIGSSAASRVDVGAGGHWLSLGSLRIGSGGEGILNIDAGGTVESAESRIGTGAGGGKAVVGDGGHWITGNLALGAGGHGELAITNGGTVGSEIAVIGLEPSLGNSVVVRGVSALMTPSSWNMDILEVGRAGTGQLEIRDAGHIQAGILFVAERAGVTGSATISGLGASSIPSVLAADYLAVGRRGVGDLTIEGGAQVNVASQMTLAELETQGDATVTVTGVDPVSGEPSTLSLSADAVLTVGGKGTASLVIKSGGEVDNSSSITLVQSETATKPAEVRVEGSDSLLKTDILIIKGGAARVTLADGKVTCGSVDIG